MHEYSMFERLPLRSQTKALARDGIVLGHRRFNGWSVTLYTLHNAFVEVWAGKGMEVVSTFKSTASALAVLEPYIDELDVAKFLDMEE